MCGPACSEVGGISVQGLTQETRKKEVFMCILNVL